MIVSWMAYSIAVALLLGGAAAGAERCLRLYGKAARWVWVTALVATISLPMVGLLVPEARSILPALPQAQIGAADLPASLWQLPGLTTVSTESHGTILDEMIVTLWISATLSLLLLYSWSAWRLDREVRTYSKSNVGGIPVLVSQNLGPAVVGLRRGSIVLPEWALECDEQLLSLLAQHEHEHLRVGDSRLLLAALSMLVLLPWNVALWWYFGRLRLAVEADCDLRLLRGGADLQVYSSLLLDIGSRRSTAPISAPISVLAFSRNRSSLFRRIKLMTSRPRKRFAQAALAMAATLMFALLACEMPLPFEEEPDGARASETAANSDAPTYTVTMVRPNVAVDTSVRVVVRQNNDVNREVDVEPLIVVDGVIMGPESRFDIESLDTQTIERIEVVKGGAAEALYGERGANGVINIYLKQVVQVDTTGN